MAATPLLGLECDRMVFFDSTAALSEVDEMSTVLALAIPLYLKEEIDFKFPFSVLKCTAPVRCCYHVLRATFISCVLTGVKR